MSDVKVKNIDAPVIIGGRIVLGYGGITLVDEKALKDYCKAVSGSHVFTNFLTVVDEDYEKKKKAEKAALEAKAANEVKAKVLPEIKAELTKKIGDSFAKESKSLNEKIESLNTENARLADEIKVLKNPVPETGKDKTVSPGDDATNGEFVLDPEKHHIEHRGAGQWFVMDKEEKVHGPLSADDRKKFEEMLK